MSEEDQPKSNMWDHPEMLEEWFEQVKARRANPNMTKIDDEWGSEDMDQNELTAQYRK
jgi:hypothetical protein